MENNFFNGLKRGLGVTILGLATSSCTFEGDTYTLPSSGSGVSGSPERVHNCQAVTDYLVSSCGFFDGMEYHTGDSREERIEELTAGCTQMVGSSYYAPGQEWQRDYMDCVYDTNCDSQKLASCFMEYDY